ncbi:MAG: bifunctional 2-polyprenyl-6-hydroxyphenol methylase/3-demethylubiquinol 3-O-methyltransferase UbiG, partial [Pseudomonadota bacterium]
GAIVTAVDPAERNIAIATRHAEAQGLDIDYRCGSVENLDSGDFDLVLNMEVVEHVDMLPDFMAACCSKVAPAGMHIVATINRNPLSWLVAIVGAEYVLSWLPKGTHQWRKFVTPAETEAMLNRGGMKVADKRGVSVSPFTRNIRVVDFTGVNYMMASSRDE